MSTPAQRSKSPFDANPITPHAYGGWYRSRARQRRVTEEDSKAMADSAWSIAGRLTAGIILYAGLGWLLSLWVGNQPLCVAMGAIVGLGLSFYLIFRDLSHDPKRTNE